MELRQLQCMVACAKTKSFSKAAELLYTSQSNVSKTIASLEKELGKKLFVRKQHGIELTEKGRQIYKYAADMIEYSSRILYCAQEDDEELRVSYVSSPWFAGVFSDYYLQHMDEGIHYRFMNVSLRTMLRRIAEGEDQLGFAWILEDQLGKLSEEFQANHIGHLILKSSKAVLYGRVESGVNGRNELPLIQGPDGLADAYIIPEAEAAEGDENSEVSSPRKKVVVTTNSDYVVQEMIHRTNLSYVGHEEIGEASLLSSETKVHCGKGQAEIRLVCIFRNDQVLEKQPKQFLSFVRAYQTLKK